MHSPIIIDDNNDGLKDVKMIKITGVEILKVAWNLENDVES